MSRSEFHVHDFPLHGQRLIEANAGTGKTYSITMLYLRLLLEHDLTVDKIAVCTYTRAATHELSTRIYGVLVNAQRVAQHGPGEHADDAVLDQIIENACTRRRNEVARQDLALQLQLAITDFDRACISTIHGLAQKWLIEYAFLTGSAMDNAEIGTGNNLLREAAFSVWESVMCGPQDQARMMMSVCDGPEAFMNSVEVLQAGGQRLGPGAIVERYERLQARLSEQVERWNGPWKKQFIHCSRHPGLHMRNYPGGPFRNGAEALARQLDEWFSATVEGRTLALNDTFSRWLGRVETAAFEDWYKAGQADPEARQPLGMIKELVQIARKLEQTRQLLSMKVLCDAADRTADLLDTRKRALQQLSFDDLVRWLDRCLEEQPSLRKRIQDDYPFAMIDEFQDSSRHESGLFQKIYPPVGKTSGLIMIGDPKQAIYGFKGGDIHAYLGVSIGVPTYALPYSFRSSPEYLARINRLFDDTRDSFRNAAIIHGEVRPGAGWESRLHKLADFQRSKMAPIEVWDLCKPEEGGMDDRVQAAVVEEAIRLLSVKDDNGGPLFLPQDIAVLGRTNDQCDRLRAALLNAGIPAASASNQSVFAQPQAREIERFLRGLASIGDTAKMRLALASELVGMNLADLRQLADDDREWQKVLRQMERWAFILNRDGPAAILYRRLQAVAPDLLRDSEGQRALTNYFQLAQLIQGMAERGTSIEECLDRYRESLKDPDKEDEDQLLRLESDANAVQVMTVHGSKGLQYDVVLVPYAWHSMKGVRADAKADLSSGPFVFHKGNEPFIDAGSEERSENAKTWYDEQMREELRLLYVALTRARYRCVFGWNLGTSTSWHTGLPWLLLSNVLRDEEKPPKADIIRPDLHNRLAAIEIPMVQPEPAAHIRWRSAETQRELSARQRGPLVDDPWSITSFSALTRSDTSAQPDVEREEPEELPADLEKSAATAPAFSAMPGARFGNCFHYLLETIDFTSGSSGQECAKALHRFGLAADGDTVNAVRRLVDCTLRTPLTSDGIRLRDLPQNRRRAEMEFHFSVSRTETQSWADMLKAHDYSVGEIGQAREISGLMTGLIDLVFEVDGVYYLLDYKTSFLGPDREDYRRPALHSSIREHRYHLQYLIYLLALHRYLHQVLPGYDVHQHLGGAYYLYVRGMDPGDNLGIYFDRPPADLILAMDQLFSGKDRP